MKSQHIADGEKGMFFGEFIHKYHDGGNADQSLLAFTVNQLGKVEINEQLGIVTIDFYGAMEADGFLKFCERVVKENSPCPACGHLLD